MKGIETKYYKLQDLSEASIVKFITIPTEEQKADMFTKQMDGPIFIKQLEMIGRSLSMKYREYSLYWERLTIKVFTSTCIVCYNTFL